MAFKADLRSDDTFIEGGVFHVVYNVRRNSSRGWRIEYQVTRLKERPFSGTNRDLLNEWIKQPEQVEAYRAWLEAQPPGARLEEYLNLPEVQSLFDVFIMHERATRIEQYYEPVRALVAGFDDEAPPEDKDWTRRVYLYVQALPCFSNVRAYPPEDGQ